MDKIKIVPVVFYGWYVNDVKIDNAVKGSTVVAKFVKSSGNAGAYKIRIRRHIASLWTVDQIIEELPFEFTGNPVHQDVSFIPQFCSGESNTKGYYAELVKDGYVIWEMDKSYPPRLKIVADKS